jgi:hypothetical protein
MKAYVPDCWIAAVSDFSAAGTSARLGTSSAAPRRSWACPVAPPPLPLLLPLAPSWGRVYVNSAWRLPPPPGCRVGSLARNGK